jgi:hypothetical protein
VNYGTVKHELLTRKREHCRSFECRLKEPGVYGLFAQSGQDAAFTDLGLEPCEHGLLYIGVATNSLADRYHPAERSSGTSSPRRSFGALLREKRPCEMWPKPAGTGGRWEFEPKREEWLSCWMKENLAYAWVPLSQQDAKMVELLLIRELTPPLNIKHVGGADRSRLIEARDRCNRLARGGAMARTNFRRIEVSLPWDNAERLEELAAHRNTNMHDLIVEVVQFLLDGRE